MKPKKQQLDELKEMAAGIQIPEWKSIVTIEDKMKRQNASTIVAQCCKPGPPCGPSGCFPCKPK